MGSLFRQVITDSPGRAPRPQDYDFFSFRLNFFIYQRPQKTFAVSVMTLQFAAVVDHRIDCPDFPRRGVELIEERDDGHFVGDGDVKAPDVQSPQSGYRLLELRRFHPERNISVVQSELLKSRIVHRRGHRVLDGVADERADFSFTGNHDSQLFFLSMIATYEGPGESINLLIFQSVPSRISAISFLETIR